MKVEKAANKQIVRMVRNRFLVARFCGDFGSVVVVFGSV